MSHKRRPMEISECHNDLIFVLYDHFCIANSGTQSIINATFVIFHHNPSQNPLLRLMLILSQSILHLFFFVIFGTGQRTARIASSKTVLSPFCVRAEHSRYLTAPTSFAIARPYHNRSYKGEHCLLHTWGYVMGANRFSFNLSMVSLSSLKSNLVPTRIIGTCGQWWRTWEHSYNIFLVTVIHTSGYHLARTFSKLAGLTKEKQIKNTSLINIISISIYCLVYRLWIREGP